MSRVGLLGASAFQEPLLETLLEDGHDVIVISPDGPYPLLHGPHSTAHVDVRNVPELLALARKEDIGFFVTDQTDLPVAAIHALHALMGRPHLPPEVIGKFTDKRAMRAHGQACGLTTPRWQEVKDLHELDDHWRNTPHRMVVKPPDSQGSRGVGIGYARDLDSLFEDARHHSASGSVMVESFLEGVEVPVEGCIADGRYRTLAIGSRRDFQGARGIPAQATYVPFNEEDSSHAALDWVVRKYVENSGVRSGITHAEVMVGRNDAALVEIALRGGASFISSHIIPAVSGFDATRHLIRSFQGSEDPVNSDPPIGKPAGFHYFWSEQPLSDEELEDLRALPDVLALHLPGKGEQHPLGLPLLKPDRMGPITAWHTDRHLDGIAQFSRRHPHIHFT